MATRHRRSATQVYIIIRFGRLLKLRKEYQSEAPKMWDALGRRHRMMVYRRWIALSARQGGTVQWPALQDATRKRKERLQKQYPGVFTGRPGWILRATSIMMRSVGYMVRRNGYIVGIIKDRRYPALKTPGTKVRTVYCALTVAQLADLHHKGGPHRPRRSLVLRPTKEQYNKLLDMADRHFNHIVERVNYL